MTGVGKVPFRSDGEHQIYQDVRDLRKSHRALVTKVDGLATGQARTEGMVSTLLQLQRSKTPSQEGRTAAKEVLADQALAEKAERSKFIRAAALKILGGVFSGVVLGKVLSALGWL